MKCGWMDWSDTDYTDSLDLNKLEEIFGIDNIPKPDLPSQFNTP